MVRACTEPDYPEFIDGKCSRTIYKTAIKLSLTTQRHQTPLSFGPDNYREAVARLSLVGEVLPKTSIPDSLSINTKIPPLSV